MPKYASLAKLDGAGSGFTKAAAAGWVLMNFSIGVGDVDAFDGSLAAMACKNSRNSWPVLAGNSGVEWAMMSV